jgi:hypothetical protein
MADRSATALLGMDEFVVLSHIEVGGELWMYIERAMAVVLCPAWPPSGTGEASSRCATCRWLGGPSAWCGASAAGTAPIRTAHLGDRGMRGTCARS